MRSYKQTCQEILNHADVKINGNNPWDIQVHNPKTYQRVLAQGSLGFGESYMDGWWDCKDLEGFFYKIGKADLGRKVKAGQILNVLKAKLFNIQDKKRSLRVGEQHYDVGNDLYKCMLSKRMVYTCGYWRNASNLDAAQEAKLKLVCEKIGLKKGMKVLDIGCGWGSFAKYAAEKYKVKTVGITISKEQVKLGKELCKGLPVEIRLQDYRDVDEEFDRIVSLGMFEHVGPKNYETFMRKVYGCLKENGLFLLQTIGTTTPGGGFDSWLDKYIFPGGVLPSVTMISKAAEGKFVMEDWHNFGMDYNKTLRAWHHNFTKNWEKLKDKYSSKVGGKFKRMWDYYLLLCAGTFKARELQLWQVVFSKRGVRGGYKSVR